MYVFFCFKPYIPFHIFFFLLKNIIALTVVVPEFRRIEHPLGHGGDVSGGVFLHRLLAGTEENLDVLGGWGGGGRGAMFDIYIYNIYIIIYIYTQDK